MVDSKTINLIRDVTFKLFLEKGYEATSIRQICKAAGVEAPTFYYFFRSKKGLFFSISNKLLYDYKNCETTKFLKSINLEEKLFHIFMFNTKFAMDYSQHIQFYLRYTLFPPDELKDEIHKFSANVQLRNEMLTLDCFKEYIEQGLIKMDLQQAFQIYWEFINNSSYKAAFSNWNPTESDLEELWNLI